jgi:hypothetical protein
MMKILIEHHKKEYPGMTDEYYYVKFKLNWWSPWRYVQRHYCHADPENLRIYFLDEAIKVAKELRTKYNGPKHIVRDLDEDCTDPNKYCGG